MTASQNQIVQMFFKSAQLAEMLGVSQQVVHRMSRDGRLAPPVRLTNRIIRWRREDIQHIIDDYESKKAASDEDH